MSIQESQIFSSDARSIQTDVIHYRSLSKSAVACFLFALMGLSVFIHEVFVVLPALAVAFGIVGWMNFQRYSEELSGLILLRIGLVLGGVCLIAGMAYHVYVYNTEVPEGYRRINFSMLRENPKTAAPYAEIAPSIDGEKVFLRGYVRPGDKRKNLKQFILVGDFGSCCFGGNPKLSEVVAVTIDVPEKTVNYGYGLRRIGGTFEFYKETARTQESEVPQVMYHVRADHVK